MQRKRTSIGPVWVAIDVAKNRHEVLVETLLNEMEDFVRFANYLDEVGGGHVVVGFEPTADYHRPLGHFLLTRRFDTRLVSSLAVVRTREALQNPDLIGDILPQVRPSGPPWSRCFCGIQEDIEGSQATAVGSHRPGCARWRS